MSRVVTVLRILGFLVAGAIVGFAGNIALYQYHEFQAVRIVVMAAVPGATSAQDAVLRLRLQAEERARVEAAKAQAKNIAPAPQPEPTAKP